MAKIGLTSNLVVESGFGEIFVVLKKPALVTAIPKTRLLIGAIQPQLVHPASQGGRVRLQLRPSEVTIVTEKSGETTLLWIRDWLLKQPLDTPIGVLKADLNVTWEAATDMANRILLTSRLQVEEFELVKLCLADNIFNAIKAHKSMLHLLAPL